MPKSIFFALVVVVLSSTIGCGVSKNEANAILRLRPTKASIGPEGDFASAEAFFQTQIELIPSTIVVASAIRDLRASGKSSAFEQFANPIDGIRARLRISRIGESELINVSFTGRTAEESAILLNAVLDAYLIRVMQHDEQAFFARLQRLEKLYDEQEMRYRQATNEIRTLEEALGLHSSDRLDESLIREQVAATYRRMDNLSDATMTTTIDLRALEAIGDEASPEQVAQRKLTEARLKLIDEQRQSQDAKLHALSDALRSASRPRIDVALKKAELKIQEQLLHELGLELERMKRQMSLRERSVELLTVADSNKRN